MSAKEVEDAAVHAVRQACRAAAAEEREACCAILASGEPNTRAEQIVEQIEARIAEVPHWLRELIGEWCEATADELAEFQKQIRARAQQ